MAAVVGIVGDLLKAKRLSEVKGHTHTLLI